MIFKKKKYGTTLNFGRKKFKLEFVSCIRILIRLENFRIQDLDLYNNSYGSSSLIMGKPLPDKRPVSVSAGEEHREGEAAGGEDPLPQGRAQL